MDSKCVSLNFFALVKHEQPDEEEADYEDEQQDSATTTDHKNLNAASLSTAEMPNNHQFWHAFQPYAMPKCDGDPKSIPYDETPPPKFVYTFRGQWTFSCQFTSADALDLFRKRLGMYQEKRDGRRYFSCSVKRCPYKMIGIEIERQWWNVYERSAHNHTAVIPIGAKIGEKREKRNRYGGKRTVKAKCSMASSVASSANSASTFTKSSSSSSPKKQQNSPKPNHRPRIVLKLRWNAGGFLPDHSPNNSTAASSSSCNAATADDCANMKVPKLETQPSPAPPQAKLFELAMCVQEMRQIAAGWNLLFREKRGSYLFLPMRDSKAFKDGILLSLTDRGNHIRMDEFLALRLRKDKIQRWPKELGHATIMRLACEQCARLFAAS